MGTASMAVDQPAYTAARAVRKPRQVRRFLGVNRDDTMIRPWRGLGVFPLLWIFVAPLPAQTAGEMLEQARSARDARDLVRATELTRRYLDQQPGDAGARWMLAQLLYWQRDERGSIQEYERALGLKPSDADLRLDFARVLYESGFPHRAATVLAPVSSTSGEVAHLRRQIEGATASWVNLAGRFGADDQPLQNLDVQLEFVRLLSDQVSFRAWTQPRVMETAESKSRQTRIDAVAGVSWRASGVSVGMHGGVSGAATAWKPIGSGMIGVGLARHVALSASVRRMPYEYTLASLDSLLLVSSLDAGVDAANAPRWAGAARIRVDWFDDGNAVTTVYAWLLAPIASWLRVGYATAWEDSRESRWMADPSAVRRPGPPGRTDTIPGIYSPYYTPAEVTTHSALVATQLNLGRNQLRARAALPIYAREQAPVLLGGIGQNTVLATFARRYQPWTVAAGWSRDVSSALRWSIDAEYDRKTFYEVGRVAIAANWRPGADGR
jgi:hypothetical protein